MNTTPSGLQYIDNVVGDGAEAAAGQHVSVHYTGWLYKDGEQGGQPERRIGRILKSRVLGLRRVTLAVLAWSNISCSCSVKRCSCS